MEIYVLGIKLKNLLFVFALIISIIIMGNYFQQGMEVYIENNFLRWGIGISLSISILYMLFDTISDFYKEETTHNIFLKSFLHSQEYYRCLFYDEVTLAEGLTEKVLISSIHSSKISNKNFYFTNGKIFIPFYIELFRMYKLKVKALFDSDKLDNTTSVASALTDYLTSEYENDSKVQLIISKGKELEDDYGINKENEKKFKEDSCLSNKNMDSGFFKPYLALYCILENGLQEKFINSLEYPKVTNDYELK